jgi:hypothetical protein
MTTPAFIPLTPEEQATNDRLAAIEKRQSELVLAERTVSRLGDQSLLQAIKDEWADLKTELDTIAASPTSTRVALKDVINKQVADALKDLGGAEGIVGAVDIAEQVVNIVTDSVRAEDGVGNKLAGLIERVALLFVEETSRPSINAAVAKTTYARFKAYQDAGFTESQAIQLVAAEKSRAITLPSKK